MPQLEEGQTMKVDGSFDARLGVYAFQMPKFGAVGTLSMQMTVDGANFLPLPADYAVHLPMTVKALTPAVSSMSGGAEVLVRATGLLESAEASVAFIKGSTRIEQPATYDAESHSLVCIAPEWAPALAILKEVEAALAAEAEAVPEGGEPPAPKPIELGEAGSDSIVEISLNGQQWTTDCKHFTFAADPLVQAVDPPTGPLEGGAPIKISGLNIGDGELKARFTKLPPAEEGVERTLPAEGEAEVVTADATAADGCADVTTPVFEGAAEPFDAAVQLSADGQVYGPSFAIFRYDAAPAKGKKK